MQVLEPYRSSLSDISGNSINYFNIIVSTNAIDETLSEYDATGATTYIANTTIKVGALKRKYTAKVATSVYPVGSVDWVDMGALNSFACFDEQLNTQTTSSSDLIIEIDTSRATTVALLNMSDIVTVIIDFTDVTTSTVISNTINLRDYGVNSLYDYAYKPFRNKTQLIYNIEWLPLSKVKFTFQTTTKIGIGMIVSGVKENAGLTLYNTTVGYKDYSLINTDNWGNVTFVPRGTANIINANTIIDASAIDTTLETFKRLRASLNLFIGDERDNGFESLATVGFVQDIKIPIEVTKSKYSISIIGVI